MDIKNNTIERKSLKKVLLAIIVFISLLFGARAVGIFFLQLKIESGSSCERFYFENDLDFTNQKDIDAISSELYQCLVKQDGGFISGKWVSTRLCPRGINGINRKVVCGNPAWIYNTVFLDYFKDYRIRKLDQDKYSYDRKFYGEAEAEVFSYFVSMANANNAIKNGNFIGSTYLTVGSMESSPYFQKEVFHIPEAEGDSLYHLDLVVHTLDEAGVNRIAAM